MEGNRIGGNVKQARLAAGLSQEELARKLGVTVMTVSRLERGVVKDPTVSMLCRVGDALAVDWKTLA